MKFEEKLTIVFGILVTLDVLLSIYGTMILGKFIELFAPLWTTPLVLFGCVVLFWLCHKIDKQFITIRAAISGTIGIAIALRLAVIISNISVYLCE